MKNYYFPAFTLVELIVVITIIGILSTVWFVSYSNYLTWARDSNRYSQLTKLSDSLQVYATTKSLPLPDDYIEITASWASNVIAYQWYVWTDVLETIDYTNWGKDPKDDSFYTYYLTKDRKSLQLMALMEEAGSIALNNTITNTTFAADYSSRFPKVYGRKLWVLTEVDTNTPVQEVSSILSGSGYLDILLTNSIYNSYISNEETVTWTGSSLYLTNPKWSCKRIKQTGQSQWNWDYILDRFWEEIEVYCDMEKNSYLVKNNILKNIEWFWNFENNTNWIIAYNNSTISEYLEWNIWEKSIKIISRSTQNVGNYWWIYSNKDNILTVWKNYTVEFFAKSLSASDINLTLSVQNGSWDDNCLRKSDKVSNKWKKITSSCILNIDKTSFIIWNSSLPNWEFIIDWFQLYEWLPLEN